MCDTSAATCDVGPEKYNTRASVFCIIRIFIYFVFRCILYCATLAHVHARVLRPRSRPTRHPLARPTDATLPHATAPGPAGMPIGGSLPSGRSESEELY